MNEICLKDPSGVVLYYEDNPLNPRTEFDNLTRMVCFHRKYQLGDDLGYKDGMFNNWDDMRDHIKSDTCPSFIEPLYLYDHSGLTVARTPFSCRWDSGQIGFIYVQEACLLDAGLPVTCQVAHTVMDQEIAIYNDFLAGQVYGYIAPDGEDCWGIYGEPGEILQEAISAYRKRVANYTSSQISKLDRARGQTVNHPILRVRNDNTHCVGLLLTNGWYVYPAIKNGQPVLELENT